MQLFSILVISWAVACGGNASEIKRAGSMTYAAPPTMLLDLVGQVAEDRGYCITVDRDRLLIVTHQRPQDSLCGPTGSVSRDGFAVVFTMKVVTVHESRSSVVIAPLVYDQSSGQQVVEEDFLPAKVRGFIADETNKLTRAIQERAATAF
jgi:hypothetical protein